jgi:hypothetical protein
MIGWDVRVGEFVEFLSGRVRLGIVLVKRRMCVNELILFYKR